LHDAAGDAAFAAGLGIGAGSGFRFNTRLRFNIVEPGV
jgi:hypothetical protein